MIKVFLILLCFMLAECRFIYPHSYYYYGNYHNLRHFRRYYSLNKPPPYFDPFQNNVITEFQCPEEKFRCSYRDTYLLQCYCDEDCPENYKCCPDSCFQHKVCKEIDTKRSTTIRTTPIQTTEIVTESEQITESERITEETTTVKNTERTTVDNESANATLINENTILTTSRVSTEKQEDETTVKRTETTTEKQPAPETTQIIEVSGSGDSAIDDDDADNDDEDVTEAQVPAEIRLTGTTISEISGNSDDSTDNNRTISKEEANTDDDDDDESEDIGVEINEENLPQVPQNSKLYEEEKNRSVSTEDLPKKHEETEVNRQEDNEAELEDYDIKRKEDKIVDDDEDIGDIGSGVALHEENLPQVPQIKHELHGEEAKNRSVSTEEAEGNRKEKDEENAADMEDYFLPDYETKTSGNYDDKEFDDSTDNNRTISINKIDETPINKTPNNSDYNNKTEMITTQEEKQPLEMTSTDNNRNRTESIIGKNDNVINQKEEPNIDIGETSSGISVNNGKLPPVPQMEHKSHEEEAKNPSVSTQDLPKEHEETEGSKKEDDEENKTDLEDNDINRKEGRIDVDDDEDIGDIGSGTAVNEENLPQVPQVKHELHGEKKAKNRSVNTEDLPKEHEETKGNRKEDAEEKEADIEDYVINREKEDNIDDEDEDFGEIGSGIAVNKENVPQVSQIKDELHAEEEANKRSVSTKDLPKEREETEGNRKEDAEENEADLEDYFLPDYEILD